MKNRGKDTLMCQKRFNYRRHCLYKHFYKHRYKSGGETWRLHPTKAKARLWTHS